MRSHFRISENKRIYWNVKGADCNGKARVRNISTSGMLIETIGKIHPPQDASVISFDSTLGHNNFIPQYGQLIWSKKTGFSRNRLCGIKFIEPAEHVMSKLRQRVQAAIINMATMRRMTEWINGIFILFVVVLVGYAVWISRDIYTGMNTSNQRLLWAMGQQTVVTRYYADLYDEAKRRLELVATELHRTRVLYQESQGALRNVSEELSQTKMILAQAETMLSEAKAGQGEWTAVLEQNESEFLKKIAELVLKVASLQERNNHLEVEMGSLRGQLDFWEGNVKNVDEGKVLLNLYRGHMSLVKTRIRDFKKDVRNVRRLAAREKDRIKLMLGNNGYLIKDGKVVEVDMQKYQQTGEDGLSPAGVSAPPSDKKVEVQVINF